MIDWNARQYVYFLQAFDGGPIKIGNSIRPHIRAREIAREIGKPVVLLAVVDGRSDFENHIHRRLRDFNDHHEWFHATPEVFALIEQAKAGVLIETFGPYLPHKARQITGTQSIITRIANRATRRATA